MAAVCWCVYNNLYTCNPRSSARTHTTYIHCLHVTHRMFRVRKMTTLSEFTDILAEHFKYPRKHIRPWLLHYRSNHTVRPAVIDVVNDQQKCVSLFLYKAFCPTEVFYVLIERNVLLNSVCAYT